VHLAQQETTVHNTNGVLVGERNDFSSRFLFCTSSVLFFVNPWKRIRLSTIPLVIFVHLSKQVFSHIFTHRAVCCMWHSYWEPFGYP